MTCTSNPYDGDENVELTGDPSEDAAELLRAHSRGGGGEEARDLARLLEVDLGAPEPAPAEAEYIRGVQRRAHEWRMETIGSGVTPFSQAAHASVEASEVLDLFVKGETYDDSWVEENRDEIEREVGDVVIALLGVPSLLGMDVVECVEAALEKNGARDWEGWQTQVADFSDGGGTPADD